MTRQALIDSIESLKKESFDCASDFCFDIYLDPENQKVYSFVNTNAVPEAAYHKIDYRIAKVKSGAIPESVSDAIHGIAETLDKLIDNYEGTEWNGSNHVGQWSEDADELMSYIDQCNLEIDYYWEPIDWFGEVLDSLKEEWLAGKTAEQIIDDQYLGNDSDGMCDRSAAINWLDQQISQWAAEA